MKKIFSLVLALSLTFTSLLYAKAEVGPGASTNEEALVFAKAYGTILKEKTSNKSNDAIALSLSLTEFPTYASYRDNASEGRNGWHLVSKNQWQYQKENGLLAVNEWVLVGDKWYSFDEAGFMRTGWYKDPSSGSVYFLDTTDGLGNAVTQIQNIDGYYYYFGEDGKMKSDLALGNGISIDKDGRISVNGTLQITGETSLVSAQNVTFSTATAKKESPRTPSGNSVSNRSSEQSQEQPEEPEQQYIAYLPDTIETGRRSSYVSGDGERLNGEGYTLSDYGNIINNTAAGTTKLRFDVNVDLTSTTYSSWADVATNSDANIKVGKEGDTLVFITNGYKYQLPAIQAAGGRVATLFFYGFIKGTNTRSIVEYDMKNLSLKDGCSMTSMFSTVSSITTIKNIGADFSNGLTSLQSAFASISSLGELDLSALDFSLVTDMGSTFYQCSSLTTLRLPLTNNYQAMVDNDEGGTNTFAQCSNLTTIYGPSELQVFLDHFFPQAGSYTYTKTEDDNDFYKYTFSANYFSRASAPLNLENASNLTVETEENETELEDETNEIEETEEILEDNTVEETQENSEESSEEETEEGFVENSEEESVEENETIDEISITLEENTSMEEQEQESQLDEDDENEERETELEEESETEEED